LALSQQVEDHLGARETVLKQLDLAVSDQKKRLGRLAFVVNHGAAGVIEGPEMPVDGLECVTRQVAKIWHIGQDPGAQLARAVARLYSAVAQWRRAFSPRHHSIPVFLNVAAAATGARPAIINAGHWRAPPEIFANVRPCTLLSRNRP